MKSGGELALLRRPEYYEVVNLCAIPTRQLDIRPASLGETIWLIHMADSDLTNPGSEPIGVFGDGLGNRQYQWRGSYWGEADMSILSQWFHRWQPRWFTQYVDGVTPGRVCLLYQLTGRGQNDGG